MSWSPTSWRGRPNAQDVAYDDRAALDAAVARLSSLPPLVTSWEVERLRQFIAEAQEGKRFVLQGGDCAETTADCTPDRIVNKLKILLKMSLVLILGGRKPVVRIGRFAGQYAKPRSSPVEKQGDLELPSYYGDLVNRGEFTAAARRPDPANLIRGYEHAAMTLNFVRSLSAGGFADLHHPEYWDLFFERAELPDRVRAEYQATTHQLADALRFMEALGEGAVEELSRVEFYTSHEGLNLHYESAQTRRVPRREGFYDLTTHLPWIGERTRAIDGAHVEFFRGVKNPLGIKLGPKVGRDDVLRLLDVLDPESTPGRIVLITRMGAERVVDALPKVLDAVKGRRVLWLCDPMHGNTHSTSSGVKTRSFDAILQEIEATFDAHAAAGTILGGVHFELTGDDVTECLGGAAGITESDLARSYETACDPRLNHAQALEMAFLIARKMR
ncbi:MAG: 3-deoxy-7-phosphoheptulonate synthase class II [Polyangiales bacterium]